MNPVYNNKNVYDIDNSSQKANETVFFSEHQSTSSKLISVHLILGGWYCRNA